MATICIYHKNPDAPCADGFGAAWIVHKALGEGVEFFSRAYGEAPPAISTGQDVILVDFSYSRQILLEMAQKARSILVLDHHKSAQAELVDLPANVECVFDMERSGVMIAWDYFYPGEEPPMLFRHIEDQDLWRFTLEGTKEIIAALFSRPFTFREWDRLLLADLARMRQAGEPIVAKQRDEMMAHLRANARRIQIAGYTVPAATAPVEWYSEAGALLASGEPFAVVYRETPAGRKFSLRSTTGKGLDVSVIAKRFGGGGHRHAASFTLPHRDLWRLARGGAA